MNKKYKSLYFLPLAFALFSCGGETEESTDAAPNENVEVIEETGDADLLASTTMDPRTFGGEKNEYQTLIDETFPVADYTQDKILGSYVGSFGKNMINITITDAKEFKASGYSVCAGNYRQIEGTFDLMEDANYTFTLEEPGDDKYDGKFDFALNANEKEIKGSWVPFIKEGNSSKEYTLKKRSYQYDPTVGKYPEASQRELTDDDLNNLLEEDLTEMRNEIYARHGYSFKNKDWRYHFEALDWYMPVGVDIRQKLTDIEVTNIELIYEYESYFQDYYDDYGR